MQKCRFEFDATEQIGSEFTFQIISSGVNRGFKKVETLRVRSVYRF